MKIKEKKMVQMQKNGIPNNKNVIFQERKHDAMKIKEKKMVSMQKMEYKTIKM